MRHFKSFAVLGVLSVASSLTAFACSVDANPLHALCNADTTAPAATKTLCNVNWVPSAVQTTVETGSVAIVADTSGDGLPDVIILQGTQIQVLEGAISADLHTIPASPYGFRDLESVIGPNLTLVRDQAQAADINSDGHLDIIAEVMPENATDGTQATIIVSYGAGDGSFGPFYVVSKAPNRATILPATDFDGDKKLDLILRTSDATLIAYGKDGGFEDPIATTIGAPADHEAAARIVDVEGDGKPDILIPSSNVQDVTGTAVVHHNMGGRTSFVPATITLDQALDFATSDSSLVDLNGDKTADLLSGGKGIARQLSIVNPTDAGADAGTPPTIMAGPLAHYGKPTELMGPDGKLLEIDVATIATIGDFDGDKRLDAFLFTASGDQQVACGLDGDAFAPTLLAGPKLPSSVVQRLFGDFDADGRQDVMALSDDSAGMTLTVLFTRDATPVEVVDAGPAPKKTDGGASSSSSSSSGSSYNGGGGSSTSSSSSSSGSLCK